MARGKGKGKGKTPVIRGGISELMRQAHRMQTKLDQVKEEIKEVEWTTEAAGGKIKATINGARELVRIEIDKELVDPADCETLQDVIVSAVNAALATAEEKINEATEKVTGGMTFPGLF
jgi:DNA-binding YbaB/EbfC family protein